MSEAGWPALKRLMERDRITLSEYDELRQALPGYSRPISLEERTARILKHEVLLRARGVDFDALMAVMRTSQLEPVTLDSGGKNGDELVDEVALQLARVVIADRAGKRARPHLNSRTGDVVPDSVINDAALALIERYMDIPAGLVTLLQMRLDPKLASPSQRRSYSDSRDRAALAIAIMPSLTDRQVARKAKVNQSTISRWRRDPSFQRLVSEYSRP